MSASRGDRIQPNGVVLLMDVRRYELFCRLLAAPDPPELRGLPATRSRFGIAISDLLWGDVKPVRVARRGVTAIQPGKETRFRIWMPRILRASRERMLQDRAWADEMTDDVRDLIGER